MQKPGDLFDRSEEWSDFSGFVQAKARGLSLAVLSGRRRIGKSYFLRRLAGSGFYHQGIQEDRTPALDRLGRHLAERRGIPGATLRLDGWKNAIDALVDSSGDGPIVLDEYPYLLQRSPELSSTLQLIYDERRQGPPRRMILCGSSLSTMQHLLNGSHPLRGRAQLDVRMKDFDFRLAREFWNIEDYRTAFSVDAVLGGAAGYRDLITEPPPQSLKQFPQWLGRSIMNPSHALYREDEFLLREDPKLEEQSLYKSILSTVAAGERTPSRIGGRIGRDRTALGPLLNNLINAGFLRKETDLGNPRSVTYLLADPIVRFSQLVLAPNRDRLDERKWSEVWQSVQSTWRTQMMGPHLEDVALTWLRSYASPQMLGGVAQRIGKYVVADKSERATLELDAVVLDRDDRVLLIGEVKATEERRGIADLARLERAKALLGPRANHARLMILSLHGFDPKLKSMAKTRSDIELVTLQRLYEGE
jgi:AAA+ ATPase superfamily predicted ATPase